MPSDNTRELQLKGGQAQVDEFPAWSTVSSLKATSGITMNLFNSTRTDYLAFNETVKPFQDVHVRRAISYAINRAALVKAVLFGNGKPANSLFPPQVPYYQPTTQGLQYNLAAAKAEMAKSSVPHGFTTTILVSSGFSDYLTIATILQSELKPLGINLKIQQLDPNTANLDQQNLKYDMTLTYWTMDIPDPDELATFAVDPNSGARSFFTAYNNPTVVKDTHLAEQTLATSARQALYNTVQADSAAGRVHGLPLLLALRLRHHLQRARFLRHAARQLPPGERLDEQVGRGRGPGVIRPGPGSSRPGVRNQAVQRAREVSGAHGADDVRAAAPAATGAGGHRRARSSSSS